MNVSRRQALMTTLFGAGAVGLRALATGLPAAFLLDPRKALASPMCATPSKAQYFILSTSGLGDPINTGAPGTYDTSFSDIWHSQDPSMKPAPITIRGNQFTAALPWSTLANVPGALDRTVFWHLMTNTPVHPKEPEVLQLMGAAAKNEMLPSLLAKAMAPCLNTIQTQPLSIGANGPGEALAFSGSTLPVIPPLALKDTLSSPAGPLTNLQTIRDQTMAQLYDLYKTGATPTQQAYIDAMVTSQQQIRSIHQDLLNDLSSIMDNTIASQITAAVTLIRMNVSPVISIHIPFGGDNHSDKGLAKETTEGVSGVQNIVSLLQLLQKYNLEDQVTFMTLNVFGRTLATNGGGGTNAQNGRAHNGNHQVSVTIGKPFKGGVIGGIAPVSPDYGATAIDSMTGASTPNGGDVSAVETLGSFGQSLLAAVGADPTVITVGKPITAALA